jgi:hypothetical protein
MVMEKRSRVFSASSGAKFEVHCDAGKAGELRIPADSLSVRIGQLVLRDDGDEMWHSVVVRCEQAEEGLLTIKVILCHFDWEEVRQIALLQSKLNPSTTAEALTVNLEEKED